jgi:hypothetical protein
MEKKEYQIDKEGYYILDFICERLEDKIYSDLLEVESKLDEAFNMKKECLGMITRKMYGKIVNFRIPDDPNDKNYKKWFTVSKKFVHLNIFPINHDRDLWNRL